MEMAEVIMISEPGILLPNEVSCYTTFSLVPVLSKLKNISEEFNI